MNTGLFQHDQVKTMQDFDQNRFSVCNKTCTKFDFLHTDSFYEIGVCIFNGNSSFHRKYYHRYI